MDCAQEGPPASTDRPYGGQLAPRPLSTRALHRGGRASGAEEERDRTALPFQPASPDLTAIAGDSPRRSMMGKVSDFDLGRWKPLASRRRATCSEILRSVGGSAAVERSNFSRAVLARPRGGHPEEVRVIGHARLVEDQHRPGLQPQTVTVETPDTWQCQGERRRTRSASPEIGRLAGPSNCCGPSTSQG